jgi:hypothetical protein
MTRSMIVCTGMQQQTSIAIVFMLCSHAHAYTSCQLHACQHVCQGLCSGTHNMEQDFALAPEAVPTHMPRPMLWHAQHGAGLCPLVGPTCLLEWGQPKWYASALSVAVYARAHDVEMLDAENMSWQCPVRVTQGSALVVNAVTV